MRSLPVLCVLSALLILSGCNRNLGGATYTSGNTVGKVVYGKIVSARQVTVQDNDQLGQNTAGMLAGGVLGGIAGSGAGGGTGNSLATAGGAIAGATLGAYVQDQLSTATGYEYIIKLEGSQRQDGRTGSRGNNRRRFGVGADSGEVAQDVNDSIQMDSTSSGTIAVVQQDEAMLRRGQRVMVIYSDDRPRVVPAD